MDVLASSNANFGCKVLQVDVQASSDTSFERKVIQADLLLQAVPSSFVLMGGGPVSILLLFPTPLFHYFWNDSQQALNFFVPQ